MRMAAPQQSQLQQLQSWLEAGWRIEEPIVQRSAYYTVAGRVCAFEVVLNSCDERRVVVLEDQPDVQQLLRQQGLLVLDLA